MRGQDGWGCERGCTVLGDMSDEGPLLSPHVRLPISVEHQRQQSPDAGAVGGSPSWRKPRRVSPPRPGSPPTSLPRLLHGCGGSGPDKRVVPTVSPLAGRLTGG